MSDPYLYLEDLVKAEVPKPPKNIGGGSAPSARQTLAGGPKATPKASSGAKAIAQGVPGDIGGGAAPPAAQTLKQANPNPPVSPNAKAVASGVEWEYYKGSGTPPAEGGYEQSPTGKWRRPVGSGGKGTSGEAEGLIEGMGEEAKAKEAAKDESTQLINEITKQEPEKRLVSSGKEAGPVGSSAAKIEESKRAAANGGAPPPVSAGAKEAVASKKAAKKEAASAKKDTAASIKEIEDHIKAGESDKANSALGKLYESRADMQPDDRKKLDSVIEKMAKQSVAAGEKKAKADKLEGKTPKDDKDKPVPVTSPEMEMERDVHKQQVQELVDSIKTNMDSGMVADEAKAKQLENVIDVLEKQANMKDMPTQEEKKAFSTARKAAGEYGKKPKEADSEEQVAAEPKKTNYAAKFNSGMEAGTRIGHAAATTAGAGGIASTTIDYASSGAVNAGHHLLSGGKVEAPASSAAKAPKKGAEVEQSSMKTEKSLELYLDLDLIKAVQSPNIGTSSPSGSRAKMKHEASYDKRPAGIASAGLVTKEDPDQKRKTSGGGETVSEDIDEKLKFKKEEEEETDTEKSLVTTPNPTEFLKSLNHEVREELKMFLPNDMETAFMVDVLDYDPILVSKGQMSIKGKDRHRFNEWAQERLYKSISSLNERVSR